MKSASRWFHYTETLFIKYVNVLQYENVFAQGFQLTLRATVCILRPSRSCSHAAFNGVFLNIYSPSYRIR
jgi:hypothetical protein